MSMFKISENSDPNYLATVVKLTKIEKHPNADKLNITEVFGNTIVIAKDSYKEGDLVVYFPVESSISLKFLSWANLLRKPELNADQKTVGYFDSSNCRVKAISLRGIPSQGFLFKVSELAKYYNINESEFKNNDSFDTVGSDLLVSKYIKGTERKAGEGNVSKSRVPKWLNTSIGYFPRPVRKKAYVFVNAWYNRDNEGIVSRIVPGQFKHHYKTEHIGKNIFILKPEDSITTSSKCHGTSSIYGNILVKKYFNPFRTIWNSMGGNIPDKEYTLVYSSRSVVKNRKDGTYTDDVWGIHAKNLGGKIPEGITLFGEIVGYTPTGKMIQKNYSYGVPSGTSEFWVYRITHTDKDGVCREFTFPEIQAFCEEHKLTTVPVYYTGLATDLFPDIPINEEWNTNFLKALKEKYLDKTCEFCTTGVVNEGIVVKINSRDSKPVFKFKSPLFEIKESAARDTGEQDMEEDN